MAGTDKRMGSRAPSPSRLLKGRTDRSIRDAVRVLRGAGSES